ncbi:hypothetical protein [Marinigracilibium pacificum]|uniref:Uncharacterized protein n=1 Tax=Marinigracilibium pacificum TaxID=2729599 RepID=A0A848IZL0_9BACT|nr:hypothetical protein [Marinigracilibium pacificum]NMM48725.1 hypothetical protein [Marinigracilibium pacificum]
MRILLALLLFILPVVSFAQVRKASIVGDELYSIKTKNSQSFLYLHQNDSTKNFDHAKYKIDNHEKISLNLSMEISTFDEMWKSAIDGKELEIKTIQVEKPEKFDDVLKTLAEYYLSLEEKPFLDDYDAIGKMIHQSKAYLPIYEYLHSKGLEVTGIKVERVGIAKAASLNNLGIKGNPIVPVPYLIYLQVN